MTVGLPAIDLNQVQDPMPRQEKVLLLNLVRELRSANHRLRAENQQLWDEISRLKGEQGWSDVKPSEKRVPVLPHSSEKGWLQPEQWKKWARVAEMQSRLAPLPPGYVGQLGLGVRAFVLPVLYFVCQMTKPKIVELLTNFGVRISEWQVSNLLIHDQERFHGEKRELAKAGLRSRNWHLADSSSMRIDGQNAYCHTLADPLYTVFTTKWRKDRQTWLAVVQQCDKLRYRLNVEALSLLAELGLSAEKQRHLAAQLASQAEHLVWSREKFDAWLETYLLGFGPQQHQKVLPRPELVEGDTIGIAIYHTHTAWPVIGILGSDDAPEFKHLAAIHVLCWVHDGRHYTRLTPFPLHRQETLAEFRKDYWEFYRRLVAYRQTPSASESQRLRTDFQGLFTCKTDYRALDEHFALTYAKQSQLLVVLDHPQVPLHTNQVERDLRTWVRRRKISSGARTLAGAQAWDTFLSLAVTARKLGVSFYHYIYDRIAATNLLPCLVQLVTARTQLADQSQHALAPP